MSTQHRGTFQYWKPSRRWTYAQWSQAAFAIALSLSLLALAYAVVATVVMLINLPPEMPR
jgi:sorbitol-specific phosphotransferase system component IIC